MIQSPLNYTGGKFKLLPQILPLFPKKIGRFFDFFCGGCNVGVNVDCERVSFIDKERNLIYLYQTFQQVNSSDIFEWIYEIIKEYGLSLVSRYGYKYYGCNSALGLGKYNSEAFKRLRDDFNKTEIFDFRYYVMLYVIIVYAFNNQIRFNSRGEFNLPVGKRDFNLNMQNKLNLFIERLKAKDCDFICSDFRQFNISLLNGDDFVYADPPYLITCATYNENGGWSEDDEKDLLHFLDELDSRKIRFALSNVLTSKGKNNNFLEDWLLRNVGKYEVIHLRNNYRNSNYHRLNKFSETDEVLIVNYHVEQVGLQIEFEI